jgi:hypothetical protein
MNTKAANEQEGKSRKSPRPEGKARNRKWLMPAGALLCLLGLMPMPAQRASRDPNDYKLHRPHHT